jgi:hypothetical protein
MLISGLKVTAAVGVISGFCAVACAGQTMMNVKVINRQTGETAYNYSVPGRAETKTRTHVDCATHSKDKDCVKTTRTETQYVAPQSGSYSVQGATLSLQLPDGRVAVVNCASKLSLFTPTPESRRSCRIPPTDKIQVEFKGKDAKLYWPVSIDGQKLESETYKILTVTDN